MPSINFVSNTINKNQSIINRRVAAKRLAATIINSPPVIKKVFVIKKLEEVASPPPQVEEVVKKLQLVSVSKQMVEYVPAIVDPNAPVVSLKRMN